MALFKTEALTAKRDADVNVCSSDAGSSFVICKSPEKLQHLLDALKTGNDVHYVSKGDWSMHDLVMQLLQQYQPAEVFITTYALREFSMRQLILAQHRGEISGIKMIVDYRAPIRTPTVYQMIKMNANAIFLAAIHAKITVLRSPQGCVSIVGSANWTSNPRIEAGVVSTNASLAAFHIDWIEKIMQNAEIFK